MVVINRSKSPEFPNTFCKVVYQKAQFTNVRKTKRAGKEAKAVVKAVLAGEIPVDGRPLYFHNTTVRPSWASKVKKLYQRGAHIFYTKGSKL